MTTLSILLILFGACGQLNGRSSNEQVNKSDTINALGTRKGEVIEKNIVQSIKDYYQINFGKGARLEETTNDTIIDLTYYNIPANDDDYDGFLIRIVIPLRKNQELFGAIPILEGDLNNDLRGDLAISVHTEGGGCGGNVWSQDIFVFINENGNHKLVNVASDGEVSGCNGSFRARKIENNFLIGHSSCYTENDARCCPSLHYEVKVAFTNSKLNYVSKRKIK